MKRAYIVTLILAFISVLTGCGLGDSPEKAAQEWIEAFANLDGNKIADRTCAAQQANVQQAGLWSSVFNLFGQQTIGQEAKTDVSGLKFTTATSSGSAARVRVTGQVRVAILALSQTQNIDETWQMVQENGKWKWCGQVGASLPSAPSTVASVPSARPTVPDSGSSSSAKTKGQIAYRSALAGGISVMNIDGSNQRQLTDSDDGWPKWSPDGRLIAFTRRDGNTQIYLMNADGTNLRRLTNTQTSEGSPSWSPDGRFIAFTSDRNDPNPGKCSPKCISEIYVMNADGTNSRKLTNSLSFSASPAWSPDGRLIAFWSNRDRDIFDIYLINADGTNMRRLTQSTGDSVYPTWSPDGRYIAFVLSPRDGNDQIYVMNADGTSPRKLTNNPGFYSGTAWSPDGRYIAFSGLGSDGKDAIYLMNSDGTNTHILTKAPGPNDDPAWSPQ